MSAILLFIAIIFIYLLPSVIAAARGHHNMNAICIMNVFLGWTALGWIGALIWSATAIRKEITA